MDYNEEQPLVIPDISIEDLTKQINDLKARLMPNPETVSHFLFIIIILIQVTHVRQRP